MIEMADVLGRTREAQHYRSLLERIKAAFFEAYLQEFELGLNDMHQMGFSSEKS